MASVELSSAVSSRIRGGAAQRAARSRRAPSLLGIALLVMTVYAVFGGGAIRAPAEPRLQITIALVTALSAGAVLWSATLRFEAPRIVVIGTGLLAAFALWTGLTVFWSAAPDDTWRELNRVGAYVLVLILAVTYGASAPDARHRARQGLIALTLLLTAYGLGQKLLPGLHIGGVIDLNQTGVNARLEQPLGYWNALALLLAMGAPALLSLVADPARNPRPRLAALIALQLLIVTLGFAESRGGFVAAAIALGVYIALSRRRTPLIVWTVLAVLGALAPMLIGLKSQALSLNGVDLATRESAGGQLIVALVASGTLLILAARELLRYEPRIELSATHEATLRKYALYVGGGTLAVLALGALADSGEFKHVLHHFWRSFTGSDAASNPGRLFSYQSANRYQWWVQALRAFWARPLIGWGAGSFPVIDLIFRRDQLSAANAHSVPLQWLAETGLIGVALALAAWWLLLRGGLRSARNAPDSQRVGAAVLIAVAVAYAAHAWIDWDWDIPGVTLPALIALGVLAGSGQGHRSVLVGWPTGQPGSGIATSIGSLPRPDPGPLARLLALAAVTFALCVYAASAVLPSIAAGRAASASVNAARSTPASLRTAEHEAELAAQIDPLSDAGPLASATVAAQLHHPEIEREFLLQAIAREPDDWQAWESLAAVDVTLNRDHEAVEADQRVLRLNPELSSAQELAIGLSAAGSELAPAPPADSPSGIQTP